jgi:hypothetical protein
MRPRSCSSSAGGRGANPGRRELLSGRIELALCDYHGEPASLLESRCAARIRGDRQCADQVPGRRAHRQDWCQRGQVPGPCAVGLVRVRADFRQIWFAPAGARIDFSLACVVCERQSGRKPLAKPGCRFGERPRDLDWRARCRGTARDGGEQRPQHRRHQRRRAPVDPREGEADRRGDSAQPVRCVPSCSPNSAELEPRRPREIAGPRRSFTLF